MLIRAIEPEDLDLMYLIENDRSLWKYSSHTTPFSYYQLKKYISESTADIFTDRQVRFTILDENQNPSGFVDIENFDPKNLRAAVGIVLLPEAQHKGLAVCALHEIQLYAHEIGIKQLYAVVRESNNAAQKAFLGANFLKSSILSDWFVSHQSQRENAILFQTILS